MSEQSPLIPLTPGEALQAARREHGLSRAEAAQRIRCQTALVQALEEGHSGGVAPVYLRGFLKSYLRLLEIPAEQGETILAHFEAAPPEIRTIFPSAATHPPADRWLRAASYVLASLLVGTLAWQLSHEVMRLSQGESLAAPSTTPAGQDRPATPQTPVNASIASLESMYRRPDMAPGVQAWAALDDASPTSPLTEGEHLIQVSVSADSWVEIRDVHGAWMEQDLLRAGDRRSYRGVGPYQVTFGRSSAVELVLDGQAVDLAPFARDDVTHMLLDPDGLPGADPASQ